jgi:type I restriction enzyme R subunit
MTTSSSDPEDWQIHQTNKKNRDDLAVRFKDPEDPFKIAIVRDMWLTGFDVPCLHTLYADKPMHGHNLMQAIARVNRVYKNKPGGLVVDYIGIATDVKNAVANYTESGGEGNPVLDIEEALSFMLSKYEIVKQMFDGFDYHDYFSANTHDKLRLILAAQEHILSLDNGRERFIKEANELSRAFSLVITEDEAKKIIAEIGLFQAIRTRLLKFESKNTESSSEVIDTAIKQIVDKAIVSEGIIDVFKASGIKKPEISILSDEFLAEVRDMKQKHLGLELLKKLLNDEIKTREKYNLIQGKKFSEMLADAIKRYQNHLITTAEIIEVLIDMAKEMRDSNKRSEVAGLTKDEIAFYDALAANDSAKEVLGNETLREIACLLAKHIKENASVDWTLKESVKARMRVIVKRFLRRYGYPPDKQAMAIDNVLEQAKLLADEWSNS